MSTRESDSFSFPELYKKSRGAAFIDILILFFLCIVIVGSPLPFGSVQYSSIAVLEAVAVLCLLLWILKLALFANPQELERFREQMERQKKMNRQFPFFHRHFRLAQVLQVITFGNWPRKNPSSHTIDSGTVADTRQQGYFSLFGYPVKNTGMEILAIAFFVLLILQSLPLPSPLHRWISPREYGFYKTTSSVLNMPLPFFHTFSISPFHTLFKIVEYGSYGFLFLVVVNVVRTRKLFWTLIVAIFVSASFQSIYGLYEYLSGHQHIFSYKKQGAYDAASGTFINRNHYAIYLAMTLPLAIALMLEKMAWMKMLGQNFWIRMVRGLETQGGPILIYLSMTILLGAALIFSMSRGGIVSAVAASMVLLVLYFRKRQEWSERIYVLIFVVAIASVLAIWIGLGPVIGRFAQISDEWTGQSSRWQLWKDTFHIFLQFPLIGTGAGTFEQIFPAYRTSVYDYHYVHAHNDYLQMLVENGLMMFFFMIAFFALTAKRFRTILSQDSSRLKLIQLGAFGSLVALALHSLFDFSLQIPAILVQGSIISGLFHTSYHARP